MCPAWANTCQARAYGNAWNSELRILPAFRGRVACSKQLCYALSVTPSPDAVPRLQTLVNRIAVALVGAEKEVDGQGSGTERIAVSSW